MKTYDKSDWSSKQIWDYFFFDSVLDALEFVVMVIRNNDKIINNFSDDIIFESNDTDEVHTVGIMRSFESHSKEIK